MRTKALYFPYINLPDNDWLYLMLLYWDRLSSIVPSECAYDRRRLLPHMSTLKKEGLVDFIEPHKLIDNADEFGKPFIEFIRRRIKSRRNPITENASQRFPVHAEKLSSVADELVRMNLAVSTDYPWYEMDRWVADAFMTYLATYIGSLPEVDSAPVTNNKTCFRLLGGNRKSVGERTDQRNEILKYIMPFPKDELSLSKILKFKGKHHAELARFRDHIEGLSIDLANLIDRKDRDEKRELTIQELNQEIEYISTHMKETWHDIILLDIFPIIIGSGSLMVGIQANEPITMGVGVASIPAAISRSIYRRKNRLQFQHNPLAYGALLNQDWHHLKGRKMKIQ